MELISIIITTFNRIDYLRQALDSVAKQNYSNIEIIVVDDCSTDKSYDELKYQKSIIYFKNNQNKGASESRKIGAQFANGKYIVFMDDDDYYTDFSFFSKCVQTFEINEERKLSFISANADFYLETEKKIKLGDKLGLIGLVEKGQYLTGFQYKYMKPYSTFTTMFSSNVIKNYVIPKTAMFNDSTIYLKSLVYGDAWFLSDVIGLYRIHESNISKSLNVSFLIDNLNEKYLVSREIKDLVSIDIDVWLLKQCKLTCDYFMRESLPVYSDNIKLLEWVLNHLKSFVGKICFISYWLINILYEIKNKSRMRSK